MPPFLKAGANIGIVSTARKISREAVQRAVNTLKNWQFEVQLGATIGAEKDQFAGSDAFRTQDFQQMLDDPGIDAILCAKGGYGTVRIIDQLDFSRFIQHPKWIAGFSDVTVIHAHVNNVLGLPTIHSLMPGSFPANPAASRSVDSLRSALEGNLPTHATESHPLNQMGAGEGTLIGGNLSILYNLIGSPEDFDPAGKILFIEEVDEYLYHVDRMMWALRRAGKLRGLAGLIVGGITAMNDNETPFGQTAEEIIHQHTVDCDFPVCFGFPAGHSSENRAFYLGSDVRLSVNETGGAVLVT